MITFTDVTKKYGRFTAVDNLSFEVPPQQAIAFWGPNGAGKTTLIKCLIGLLRYKGQIMVNGYDAHKDGRVVRRMLGYVPQELAFYEDMTTLRTTQFFCGLKKAPPERVMIVLEQVGLTEQLEKSVDALSGGMKQRLALGLALLADPPILVLDEPTSNLDAAARDQFFQLLIQVKAEGKTIVFTSHRREEVEALADQVLVMADGKISLICDAPDLASHLGLRSHVKLHMPADKLNDALIMLQAAGFNAQTNGTGLMVEVLPGAKADPIHVLSEADIVVTDFELE